MQNTKKTAIERYCTSLNYCYFFSQALIFVIFAFAKKKSIKSREKNVIAFSTKQSWIKISEELSV